METKYIKRFIGTPYIIEVSTVENKPGTWNSSLVSIYKECSGNTQFIGKYLRNYPLYAKETFYPFQSSDGNWYAVYSANYTCTRVMKLFDDRIEDWCGEEPSNNGFCPTEFYIPRYHEYSLPDDSDSYFLIDNTCKDDNEFVSEGKVPDLVSTNYCAFGFLSGSKWGDDGIWKLRFMNLEGVPNKQIEITEKFGYWEIPTSIPLKQIVGMHNWEPDRPHIELIKLMYLEI